ncbi:hypothetical protein JB92DRAFT_3006024 [Gautieria morchelliformis]|nr:hypothetical protein JB92DRAFT_3006024 [Gautieria morchelliformis]
MVASSLVQPQSPCNSHRHGRCEGVDRVPVAMDGSSPYIQNYDIYCDGCKVPSIPKYAGNVSSARATTSVTDVMHRGYICAQTTLDPEVTIQAPQNPSDGEWDFHDVPCRGCKKDRIRGTRWKCLQCKDYDLCDSCHSSKAHPPDHKMFELEDPEQADGVIDEQYDGEDDAVLLGLRVHTTRRQ